MDELVEFFGGFFILILFIILAIFGCVFSYNYFFVKPQCENFSKMVGKEIYYSFATGCLVNSDNGWVNYDVIVSKKHELTIKQK